MALQHLLWLQAIVTLLLAIFRLVEVPSGLVTKASVALAALTSGAVLGWYARAHKERLKATGLYLVDERADCCACCNLWLQTVGFTALAIFWLVTQPDDPQTMFYFISAGVTWGAIMGWHGWSFDARMQPSHQVPLL